ncbi:MAG TPA: uracil-DNA glycosylase family protein [Polyangiaceae bacterium]|jgi:single-strand selective monofunctional uracil DNA glycosylase|nr:uracil-DNA glycosylase family protein [Polyangiaceae bacterium]
MRLAAISRKLAEDVGGLRFSAPIAHVYNPLVYARAPHEAYLERWGEAPKEVLLLGMNPGPFGMAQTGVPFGDVAMVRDFIGVTGKVGHPEQEHPARPIQGFDCARSEVSGSRLWGFAQSTFGSAERFFARFFVVNYCPLVFMEASGKNFTPDKLRATEQSALFEVCDRALQRIVERLEPRYVVGVGAFAAERARLALAGHDVAIATVLHPSPASPQANRGWAALAAAQLRAAGIELPDAVAPAESAAGSKKPRSRRQA